MKRALALALALALCLALTGCFSATESTETPDFWEVELPEEPPPRTKEPVSARHSARASARASARFMSGPPAR
ncbi:MAG: hypothetical protein E7425_05795 [Ruminococcaceae bacterium]|nr:hypothetical protein [Oscillospiraceae bacterium]